MNKHVNNAELGTDVNADATFDALVQRIKAFNYDTASLGDVAKLVNAVRLVAEETCRRHKIVREMEGELRGKLDVAELAEQVRAVLSAVEMQPAARPGERWLRKVMREMFVHAPS